MVLFISSPLLKRIPENSRENESSMRHGLLQNIGDLEHEVTGLLEKFENSLNVLNYFLSTTADVIGILEEAGGLTVRARNYLREEKTVGQYKSEINHFLDFYVKTLEKLDTYIEGHSYNGINLLNGDNWTTFFDSKGEHRLLTPGVTLTSKALGFRTPDFSTVMLVQACRIDVMNAMDMCGALRNILLADIFTLETRMDFARESLISAANSRKLMSAENISDEKAALIKIASKPLPYKLADEALDAVLQNFTNENEV